MSFINKNNENNRPFSSLAGEKISSSSSWLLQSPEKEQFASTFLPSALQLKTEKIIWMEVLGINHHSKSCKNYCSTSKNGHDNCTFLQQQQMRQDNYNFVLDLDSSSIILPGEKEKQLQQGIMKKNDSASAFGPCATSLIQVANISNAKHHPLDHQSDAAPSSSSSPASFLSAHPAVAGISIVIYLCERLRITAPRVQWTALWLFVRMSKHSTSTPSGPTEKSNKNKSSNSLLIVGEASRVLYASACVLLSLKECFRTASHHVLVGDPLLIQHKISREELITAEMKIFSLCTSSSVSSNSNNNNNNSKSFPHRQQQQQVAVVDCYIGPSWLFRCFECLFELEPVLCRASGGLMLHWRTLAQKIWRKNNYSHHNDHENHNPQQNKNENYDNDNNNNMHHDAVRRIRTATSMAVDQDEAMRLSSSYSNNNNKNNNNNNNNNNNKLHNHNDPSSLSNNFSKISEKNVCTEEDEELSRLSNQITQDGAVASGRRHEQAKKSQNKNKNNNQDKADVFFQGNNFVFHRDNNNNEQNIGSEETLMTSSIFKKNNNHQPLLPLPMFLRGSTTSENTSVFSLMRELHKHNLISDKTFSNESDDDGDENDPLKNNFINRQQGKIPPPNSPAPSLKTNSSSSSSSSSSASNIHEQDSTKSILDRISNKNNSKNKNIIINQEKNSLFHHNDDSNNNNEGRSRSDHLHHEEQENNNILEHQQHLRYFNSAMMAACSRRPVDPTVSFHETFRVNELYRRRIREASHQVSTIATMALLHSCHFSTSSSSIDDDCDQNNNDNSSCDALLKITLDEIFSPFFPLAVFHACGFLSVQDAAMIFGFEIENNNKEEGSVSSGVLSSTKSINCIFSNLHQHVSELVTKVPSLNNLRKPSDIILSMARKLTKLAFCGDDRNNNNNNRNLKSLNNHHHQNDKKKLTKFLNLSAHSARSSDGVLASALETLGLS